MADGEQPANLIEAIRARWRVFAAAGVLAVLAIGGRLLWQAVNDRVAADPHYRITAETIETTPPPAWVRSDIRRQALARVGLQQGLSALDPPERLEARVVAAFASHPWVRSVGRITKQPPNRLQVELFYRIPMAAVGDATNPNSLLLADAEAVRLPAGDLSEVELRRLPRVALPSQRGVATAPPQLGQPWVDPRVQGGVAIVAALGDAWWNLRLANVAPHPELQTHGAYRYPVYELVSQGGVRIRWGAAPIAAPVDEPAFNDKLARLVAFVQANGPLAGEHAPSVIDVRSSRTLLEPRTAKEEGSQDELLK